MEHILSRVRSMPWKLVRQFLPCTSSVTSLNLRKATSSFCRSARLTSNTRPFRPSEAIPRLQRHGVKFTAVYSDMMHMDFMGMSGDLTTTNHSFSSGTETTVIHVFPLQNGTDSHQTIGTHGSYCTVISALSQQG